MSEIFDFRMVGKLRESALLFYANLGLFLAIILSIALPANILSGFIEFLFDRSNFSQLLSILILFTSYSFSTGALIYSLARIRSGHHVEYTDALGAGFHFLWQLFIARFAAALIIALGFLLLIFPGIHLVVRYSLLDFAVVLEGASASEARKRSGVLTEGFWWQIFWVGPFFGVPNGVFLYLLTFPLEIIGGRESLMGGIVYSCIEEVLYAILRITLFLIYWERVGFDQTDTSETDLPAADA